MSAEILGLVFDILILVFLGATIFFAMRLSGSLNAFRAHREDFDKMIGDLNNAVRQAQQSILNLKETGEHETSELRQLVRESRALSEELQIINEAGENMARRLEELAEKNSKIAQSMEPHIMRAMQASPDLHDEIYMREPEPRPAARPQQQYQPQPQAKQTPKPPAPQPARRPEPAPQKQIQQENSFPSFMINDREFANEEPEQRRAPPAAPRAQRPAQQKSAPQPEPQQESRPLTARKPSESLQSRAERELYEALRRGVSGNDDNSKKAGGGRS
ncbi:MAG: hypothetical protein KDI13_04465 [Alphaproteobacteria bacterium]|nr:hypothetical protein [Alphaproteobacteria bacterium]